jgi:hypothetical protein
MYVHLGQSVVLPEGEILGIFDLDNASWAYKTREFLDRAEREGRVVSVSEDLPRSFVLARRDGQETMIYLCQLSASALLRRTKSGML